MQNQFYAENDRRTYVSKMKSQAWQIDANSQKGYG